MEKVLLVGGNGLVGTQLRKKLITKGYSVSILGRSKSILENVESYLWDVDSKKIDEKAITSTDYIINLAGAGIADNRWTDSRKKIIISSRVDSTKLLVETIKKTNSTPKAFISASAVGYYGAITSDKILSENDIPSGDFLSNCCQLWENSSKDLEALNIRRVIIRVGIVLSNKGGALTKMTPPFKLGFGSAIASGKQYIPWIHIDDLCEIFIKAIENQKMKGAFNAASTTPITNNEFSSTLAKTLKKPYWLPNIPRFIIKLLLGEMSVLITEGSRVSSNKILATGFTFKHSNLESVLINLLSKKGNP
jgi:uncharacterized protein (TIGR01777 family)